MHAFLPRSGLENGLSTFAAVILALAMWPARRPAWRPRNALDQGHPVRLDDAYPIAPGDATLLFGACRRRAPMGLHRAEFDEILWEVVTF